MAGAARDLDVTESALRSWVEHARVDRTGGQTALTTADREELARLRKENRTDDRALEMALKRRFPVADCFTTTALS